MFKCLVILMELLIPFFSKYIMILLSWIMMLSLTSIPWAIKNNLVHKIIIIASSADTNSDFVLILVLIFCFLYIEIPVTCIVVIAITVWILKYFYTANSVLTHHMIILVFSADRLKKISFIPFKYFISLVSLFESTYFGFFILLHKNEILGRLSSLSL